MITFVPYTMPAADVGANNPMADIRNNTYIHATYEITERVSPEEKQYLGVGMIPTILPYQMQDSYTREKKPRAFKAAVLENAYIRATFLPEIGGRLWSLYDKTLKKDLLYRNSVFQPANLALRNAWFSGGVEFNVGIKGHTPLTASQMYCEVEDTPQGEVLSMYEYERIRGVVYSVSAWLPENSRVLYLRCRIENRTDETKHMYWWSNIAVPETKGTRVIVPATDAFVCHYLEDHYLLDKTPVPHSLDTDISYPSNLPFSHDFFFKIPDEHIKWIAAAQEDGTGLIQASTARLRGRKLFLWGQKQGGRHWGEWLSEEGQSYIEIQAGLANTQMEHIPMPPQTEWSWNEAYGALEGDPAKLHDPDWQTAIDEAERCVVAKFGDPNKIFFPADESWTARHAKQSASGWGAVEEAKRGTKISEHFTFPEQPDETSEFVILQKENRLPVPAVTDVPKAYVVGKYWEDKLRNLPVQSWYSLLQLGVTLYAGGDTAAAVTAWEQSLGLCENPWAYRNIAMVEKNEYKHPAEAAKYILKAFAMLPTCRALAIETAQTLTQAGEDEKWLELEKTLPETLRAEGRIRLFNVIALLNLNRPREAAVILTPDFVLADVKEGELSVSALWFDIYRRIYAEETGKRDDAAADAKYPLPKPLDFRMN